MSTLFHDSQTATDGVSARNAAAMLRECYKALATKYSELLDGEEDSAGCGTLLGQPGCPAPPMDPSTSDNVSPTFPLTPIQPKALERYGANTAPMGKITLVSNPIDIYGKEPAVLHTMSTLMKNAKESVLIYTPYAVFNDYVYDTMKEITPRVSVTVMVNSVGNGDNFFASNDYPMHGDASCDTGIEIPKYDGGPSYHGKSLIIDSELCAVGSYSSDLRSTYLDTELMLVIQSRGLIARLEKYMVFYRKDCRRLLPGGAYEIPEHPVTVDVPAYKRVTWKAVDFVMQPFRFLI